jgi:hypothetical protein
LWCGLVWFLCFLYFGFIEIVVPFCSLFSLKFRNVWAIFKNYLFCPTFLSLCDSIILVGLQDCITCHWHSIILVFFICSSFWVTFMLLLQIHWSLLLVLSIVNSIQHVFHFRNCICPSLKVSFDFYEDICIYTFYFSSHVPIISL